MTRPASATPRRLLLVEVNDEEERYLLRGLRHHADEYDDHGRPDVARRIDALRHHVEAVGTAERAEILKALAGYLAVEIDRSTPGDLRYVRTYLAEKSEDDSVRVSLRAIASRLASVLARAAR